VSHVRGRFLSCASLCGVVLSAPALSETRTEGGYRTCSIARSTARTIGRVRLPRRGNPNGVRVVRRCRPTPRRQSSTTIPGPGSWRTDLSLHGGPKGCKVRNVRAVRRDSEGAASFAITRHGDSRVGKVAARGRAASPTKRGRIVRSDKSLSQMVFSKGYKSGVPALYPCFDDRGLSDAPCSIARRRRRGHRDRWPPRISGPLFL